MRRPLIALALLLVAPLVCAQVYKWTDAKGTVHYSETPPPEGTKYNQVNVTGTVDPITPPASSSSAGSADASAKPAAPVVNNETNNAKFCSVVQSNITTLQGNTPVVDGSGKQLLSADQRQQQLAQAQSQLQQYCNK